MAGIKGVQTYHSQIRDYIAAHPGATTVQIADALGVRTARETGWCVRKMRARGLLRGTSAGWTIGREPLLREKADPVTQKLRIRERQMERRAKLRAMRPPKPVLTEEQKRERARARSRAKELSRQKRRAELRKPKPPGLADCAKAQVQAPTLVPLETSEQFLARGGRIEVLPAFQPQPFLTVPARAVWRGARAAA